MFRDRHDAGLLLAQEVLDLEPERPVVIALPRGGVPVAYEVAHRLGAPLEVLAVRKLGAPADPEYGVGAIAEDGTAVLDEHAARTVGMTDELLAAAVRREVAELVRRVERYRDGRSPIDVRGQTVIVVDDGLATGLTDLAAVRALRARGARRIIVAVPVGSHQAVELLRGEADQVICHTLPEELLAVGSFYEDFAPVSDAEVISLLDTTRDPPPTPGQTHPSTPPAPRLAAPTSRELLLDIAGVVLAGDLTLPHHPRGLVVFAHGSGSSRLSPRNRQVAARLNRAGLGTLLFDLLTDDEGRRRELVFDIPLLAHRLEAVTRWAIIEPDTKGLPIGYFGASTGAAAALWAASGVGNVVRAVVCRGGRPDLAAERLPRLRAPTLLVVGSRDPEVLALNRRAAAMLRCPHSLLVVRGAGHLFAEPGTLEEVARVAADWFGAHLATTEPSLAAAG